MILTKRTSRIAALGFGLTFFVTAGVDALGFHECPHHDAIEAPASAHHTGANREASTGHAEDADHEGHDTSGDHTTTAPTPADHGGHAGPCTCVGSCQLGGQSHLGPALGAKELALAPAPAPSAVRVPDRYVAHLPGTPAFFLPFANAPPGLDAFSV